MSDSVVLIDIGDIKSIWNSVFDDAIYSNRTDDYVLQAIQNLKRLVGNTIINVPDGTWDMTICWNVVWYYGYVNDTAFNIKWKAMYPYDLMWIVNVRAARLPVLILKKSLLSKVNTPQVGEKLPSARDYKLPKHLNKNYCYLWDIWDPAKFVRHYPVVSAEESSMKDFCNSTLLPPLVEFRPIKGTDLVCTPLVHSAIAEDDFYMESWGLFEDGYGCMTPLPLRVEA